MTDRSKSSSARSLAINAVLTLVAFVLLGLAVWSNRTQIREVFERELDGRMIALAFGIYLTALMLTFLRWYVLVRALDLPFRLRDAVRLGFIGNVFNLVIPGAVGGDVIKAAFLCREQSRKTQAVASMVIDRVLGLLGLFLLAGISGVFAWDSATPEVRRLIAVVWAAVFAGLVGLAILFTPALYRPLERLFVGKGKLEVLFTELLTMAAAYRRRIGTVFGMLVMASVIHLLFVLAFYIVSRALFPAGAPSLAQHVLMVPLVLFTTAVPLPFGALGLSEQASEQLLGLVGHPSGAVAMMGFRVLMYAGGLVSVCVYLANVRQVRDLNAEPTPSLHPADDLLAVDLGS